MPRPHQPKPATRKRPTRPLDTKDVNQAAFKFAGQPGSTERRKQLRRINSDLYDHVEREDALGQLTLLMNAWADSDRYDLNDQVVREVARR